MTKTLEGMSERYTHFYLNGKWYVRDLLTWEKVRQFGGSRADQKKAIALKDRLNEKEKDNEEVRTER